MAATANWFGLIFPNIFGGQSGGDTQQAFDYLSDTISMALTTSSYSPNQNTHDFFNDVTNELATSGGYTAGGASLGTKTLVYATLVTTFDAADTSWTSATFTARIGVLHDRTPGTDATRPLILWQNFGADQSPSGGTFTIQYNSSGIATITVA